MESGSMYESEKVLEDNLIKQLIADMNSLKLMM